MVFSGVDNVFSNNSPDSPLPHHDHTLSCLWTKEGHLHRKESFLFCPIIHAILRPKEVTGPLSSWLSYASASSKSY